MTSTTHNGGGRPRLIRSLGGAATAPEPPPREGDDDTRTVVTDEYDLRPDVTTIGSSPTADLRLDGLDERHAEIRRDELDEYVFVNLTAGPRSRVNGVELGEQALHTGDRIELDGWTFSYFRDESADHGRPYGGRQGGELSQQRPQPERSADLLEGGAV